MKYLITGGTGFIGNALANALRENLDEIIILTRKVKLKETNIQYTHDQ